MTQQQGKLWHDDGDFWDHDQIIGWYDDYQKCKAQKAQIKKRVNASCLPSIKDVGLEHVRRWEKRDRKIGEVAILKTTWYAEIKNLLVKDVKFGQKRLQSINFIDQDK